MLNYAAKIVKVSSFETTKKMERGKFIRFICGFEIEKYKCERDYHHIRSNHTLFPSPTAEEIEAPSHGKQEEISPTRMKKSSDAMFYSHDEDERKIPHC